MRNESAKQGHQSFVSVIIPVYNAEKSIRTCLASVFNSDYPDFEVILIDDGSTDKSVEQVKGFDCRLITLKQNQGPAAARNRAIKVASGEIFFFLDADMTIEPDTLTKTIQTFREKPGISALFCSYQKDTPVNSLYSKYKNLLHHYTHQISREDAATFCAGFGAIKKQVVQQIGEFDETYRFLEDIELGYRMHQAGFKIFLNKQIQLTHYKHYSFWGLIKSDVLGRAKPWTELILQNKIFRSDLNTRYENVLSLLIVYFILALIPVSYYWSCGWFVLVIFFLLFLVLNRQFFSFVFCEKGFIFLLKAVLLNWFGYLYSGVGSLLGFLAWAAKLNRR
jgi:glycosyltransferase involved in cell wall biosynthesis